MSSNRINPLSFTVEEALTILKERGVYLLFDPRTCEEEWEWRVVALYELGIPWFQLRAKGASDEDIVRWARRFRELIPRAILIVNDRPDLAQFAVAHGVHLGPNDFSPLCARKLLGENAIVGYSADQEEEFRRVAANEVTYFGVGTFRATLTKPHAGEPLGEEGLRRVQTFSPLPKVAVGGIVPEDLPTIRALGYFGIAVHRGIWLHESFLERARAYLEHWQSASDA